MPTDPNTDPDVQKFLTDPKFAKDKKIIEAVTEAHFEARARDALAARKDGKPAGGFLDKLFCAIFPNDDDGEHDNVFDHLFGGKRRR